MIDTKIVVLRKGIVRIISFEIVETFFMYKFRLVADWWVLLHILPFFEVVITNLVQIYRILNIARSLSSMRPFRLDVI